MINEEHLGWTFEDDPDVACISIRQILDGTIPVLHVAHDPDEVAAWQFLGLETPDVTDGVFVSLGWMINHDPSIEILHNLPIGWHAWRTSPDEEWYCEPDSS